MSLETEEFKNLFENKYATLDLKEGGVISGRVVSVSRDFVVINVGFKSEGYVNVEEFRNLDGEVVVKPGDEVKVIIEELEDDNGRMILSKEKADALDAWDHVEAVYEKDGSIEGLVINKVKGGMFVNLGGIKAFLPGSQIDLKPVKSLDKLINQKFTFKILKLNKLKGNIVLSRRAILEQERHNLRKDILENIKEGQIIRGTVKNITDYGAFIDLGGIDGLLHITDMTWGRVNHPSELFKVNDEIDVVVLKYDPESEKVSLGFKQLLEDPWNDEVNKYSIGQKVSGKVISVTDYGVFVEIEKGIEGLVHISELSWSKKVKHPSKIVNVGQAVETIVIDIDRDNRKIALGLKQLEQNPWDVLHQKFPVGTKLKGKIRNITDFGIFVGIDEEEIDGLVHISDLSWDKEFKWPSEDFKKGQDIDVVVLNIDKDNQKFALGVKQLSDDPYAILMRTYPLGSDIKGQVVDVSEKGIVVQVESHQAFVPSSEIGVSKKSIKESFQIGEEVTGLVKKYDDRERKMIISLKALQKHQEKQNMKQFLEDQGNSKVTFQDLLKK